MKHELSVRELLDLRSPTWAISNVLPNAGLGLIFGPVDAGQSLIALDMACTASLGRGWHGRATEAGRWVRISVDSDLRHLRLRLQAWIQRNGAQPDLGFVLRWAFYEDASVIIDAYRTNPPKAMVIDVGAHLVGLGTFDMNEFVSTVDRIRRELGCAVVVVASEGGQHPRGQGISSLIGAVDVAIRVERLGSEHMLRCIKSVSAGLFEPIVVERQLVSVLDGEGMEQLDEGGSPITSCVIVPVLKERMREARASAPE